MVTYIKSDLQFILDQIKIAEAHAAGQPLFGPGGLVPAYTLSFGLRTVDGTYNNLLPGQETWGSADRQFTELLDPEFRTAEPSPFGPPGPPTNYNPSDVPASVVFDSSLRTISNLIVDQTLGNPAAILTALDRAGNADPMADLPAITAIYAAFKPDFDAEYQARVVMQNAKAAYEAALVQINPQPATPVEIQAALDGWNAAIVVHDASMVALIGSRAVRDAAVEPFGIAMDGDNVSLLNIAPDEGLSAPFNSWFTLFGQFFDHGLDLVNKGGSGTVFIPLQPDDPLYVEGSHTNFMVLTRATVSAGQDGVMGTADDIRPVNTTTPFVDQNQTYTSHSSHQVFLRQYVARDVDPGAGVTLKPFATGHLIEGGGAQPGGMATWGEVKAQAATILGIQLTDFDVGSVPLLRTDAYGNFIPGPNGYPQLILGVGTDGIPNTADDVVLEGNPAANDGMGVLTTNALRTNMAFLADIAHEAVPVGKIADGDITIGLGNPGNGDTEYDNELLDAHFIAGDGRANENIGLTAVHHIFHSEHNRLAEHTKVVVVADAVGMLNGGASQAEAVAFLNEWLAVDVAAVPMSPAAVDALIWDGNRLFQAAKFGTEMQYQHLVFEDFARKIQPAIDFFVVPDGYHADINPNIVAEFAHVVYRFGHSMLTEQIDRLDSTFTNDQIGLIEAFLNPMEFDAGHTIDDRIAAGDIIRGMTRQVGNEIDEFVTTALRNNLLGLPLDLATINLARGRDTGVPSLNAARRDFFEASQNAPELKPYDSWVEFAGALKNEASVINFIAAYGLHPLITAQTTIDGKRDAAMTLIFNESFGGLGLPGDRDDFLNGTGAWANLTNGVTTTGIDNIDLWIGGLAEKIMPFGGMLGSTFNFVFEVQLEKLQDGDRFYYLQRLDGLHLLSEMENNTFAKLISKNADAGHLPSDVFSTPGLILEVDRSQQWNPGLGDADPTGGTILVPLVSRDNPATLGPDTNYLKYNGDEHVLLGGTDNNDILIGSIGDDTLYGDGGNDRMEGGFGNDQYFGGDGDDIITDMGGDDIIRAGAGHDAIHAGPGTDLVVGDAGQDFIVLGNDMLDEAFGGVGNDFILGSKTTEQSMGGEGHDWIEIGAWTGAVGDNFDDQFAADSVKGHDVFLGDGGFDEFIGEGGDDIWVGSLGRGKFDGMSGFDWATYKDMPFGINADLFRLHFDALPLPPSNAALDEYAFVEGVSGSRFNDEILGSDVTSADMATQGARGSVLDAEGIALINGLQEVVGIGVTSFDAGNILLGGAGSDLITGRGGDDIIDGDKWLNVRISVREFVGPDGGIGAEIDSADSMKDLVTKIFNGTYNPGQLQIVREILKADGVGDVDVAIFSGERSEYDISFNPNGTVTVAHTGGLAIDGTDTISNVEILRFTDQDIMLQAPMLDLHGNTTTTTTAATAYRDEFTTPAHNNSNGTVNWAPTPWVESGDSGGVTTGQIQLDAGGGGGTNQLRFVGGPASDGASIARTVNLAGVTAATLSFSYDRLNNNDNISAGETVQVQFSATGSFAPGNFTVLQTITNTSGNANGEGTSTFNLNLAGAGANSAIRFVSSAISATTEEVRIDNVNIATTTTTLVPGTPGNNFATTYTEDGAAVGIAAGALITDDGATIASARVVLTNASAGDVLSVLGGLPGGISSSIDNSVPGQITLNLNGVTSKANYQSAIQQVRFSSTSQNPSTVARILQVSVNDGLLTSNLAIATVNVVATNDPPVAVNDTVINNSANNVSFAIPHWVLLANDSDPESAVTLTGVSNVTGLTSAVNGGGVITVTDNNGTDGSFQYTINDGSGTGNATASATVTVDRTTATTFNGGNGAETYVLGTTNDTVNSGGGNDIILSGGGVDTINAGSGNDRVDAGDGNDIISGGLGDDVIDAGTGNDTIIWNANATGATDGFDMVDGNFGQDTFQINGNGQIETYRIYARQAALDAFIPVQGALTEIVITRTVGLVTTVIAELDNIEEIRVNTLQVTSPGGVPPGGTGANTGDTIQVIGDFNAPFTSLNFNTITIDGSEGDDTVDISSLSSAHRIVFRSNGGKDTIIGTLRPQDVIELPAGMTLADFIETTLDGVTTLTQGEHSITYDASGGPTIGSSDDDEEDDEDDVDEIDEDDNENENDEGTAPGFPGVGTPNADVLIGTPGDDYLVAMAGDDVLIGYAGNDLMLGGDGNDLLAGWDGRDLMYGGSGDDHMLGGNDADIMDGEAGNDRIFGDAGDDLIIGGAGDDTVVGGAGNDTFIAAVGDGNDIYFGDEINGGTGIDTLDMAVITDDIVVDLGSGLGGHGSAVSAATGIDTLWGVENVITGSGADRIIASDAVNVMDGGAGNDTFVFKTVAAANGDTIVGFEAGDRIDLSGIDANSGASGVQAFTLVSGSATAAAQLVVTIENRADGDFTVISGHVNDDTASPEFKIELAGTHNLTSTNFL